MPQENFSAQVSDWVAKTKVRMKAVRDEAVQRTISIMQTPVGAGGNMPVDTGFLRASLQVTTSGELAPLVESPGGGAGQFEWEESSITLIIKNADLRDTITASYGANYAVFQEYGTTHMEGHRFVGLAAQQWPQIVAEVAKEAQDRFG